ncbi:MAG: FAD-binding oxidoreductase [Promethearchaeota archaeon]|nr:MAG: FAD-binding oxidoreductase [Candidatus Lokiarchaeota archaeon]
MIKSEILTHLENIVGKEFASNNQEDLFIYSQDSGASLPRPVDFVVLPKTVEEIQNIVRLANEEKIPIVPMGGGMTLSGLTIPIKGGIVIDLKRMDKILEINEISRYALIEAGVTTGRLTAYLEKHYPNLEVSIPDAPPSATVTGNALIHGSGFLSQKYGNHGDMINGLEVVLPNGEICKLGSCAVSEYWFTRGPIPDLIGLFISSFGTMGIATKLAIKLYPKDNLREIVVGIFSDPKMIPDAISKITHTDIAEDIVFAVSEALFKGYIFLATYITGNSEEDIGSKIKILKRIYRKAKGNYMKVPEGFRNYFLEKPIFISSEADNRSGGGFEYSGNFIPLDKIPEAIEKAIEISKKYDISPSQVSRVIGKGHNIMFAASFSFNRADPNDMENARNALHETNEMILKLGGIIWKPELAGQKLIIEKMDPNYKKLFQAIRVALDPNGIMNPGNWEIT